jgi:hypothetical protein
MTRIINPWELEDVIPLAQAFHAEAKIGSTFSPERFLRTISQPGVVVFGMHVLGELVGCFVGSLAEQYLTTAIVAQEMMWYVKPEHRGNGQVFFMFDGFEQWAAKHNVEAIIMVNLTDGNPRVRKLYASRGYREIESHHIKFIS